MERCTMIMTRARKLDLLYRRRHCDLPAVVSQSRFVLKHGSASTYDTPKTTLSVATRGITTVYEDDKLRKAC